MTMRATTFTIALTCAAWATSALAEETPMLRTETDVYLDDDEPELIGQTLTLFQNGVVYDIELPDQQRQTVYDISRQRIILLDNERKLQTMLAPDSLIRYMEDLRGQALQVGRADAVGIDASPLVDDETGVYRVGLPGFLYRVETQALQDPRRARLYNEFSMWATRLTAYQVARGVPFARLALSQKMLDTGVVPRTVTRRTTVGNRSELVRSEHSYNETLSKQDLKLIERIGGQLVTFIEVPPERYFSVQAAEASDETRVKNR